VNGLAAWLSGVQSQAKELWAKMSTTAKVVLGMVILALVVGGVAAFSLGNRTEYVTLGTFTPQEAAQVVPKLIEAQVPYQAGDNGAILVPKDQLLQAQLVMQTNGLDNVVGLEIFDKQNLLTTQFERDVNWKRGLEGQLIRAINTLDKVQMSNVILALPKDSLFVQEKEPAKATVIIQPRNGAELSKEEVKSIVMAVSSSVTGLQPENVVVIDTFNRILSQGLFLGTTDTALSSEQMQIQQQREEAIRQQLQKQLEQVVGAGNVAVTVTAALDWAKSSAVTREVTQGAIVSQEKTSESATTGGGGSGSSGSGTGSGFPSFGETSSANGGGAVDKTSSITNFENGSKVTETATPSGSNLKSLAVTVLVNEAKVAPEQVPQLENIVRAYAQGAAGGITPAVAVSPMKFNTDLATLLAEQSKAEEQQPEESSASWLTYLGYAAAAVGVLVIGLLLRRRPQPEPEPVLAGAGAGSLGSASALEMLAAAAEVQGDEHKTPAQRLLELQEKAELLGEDFLNQLGIDPAKQKLRDEVEALARDNPETVANLLKTWIAEE
jgi:flagellar M-ring protein FliF